MLDSANAPAPHPMTTAEYVSPDTVETALIQAFAPLHKRALGISVGVVAAVGIFLLTAFHLLLAPAQAPDIALLSQYFYGYTVSWIGACIGAGWAAVFGFVAGWFLALTRNFATAVWLLVVRAHADWRENRDLVDRL